MIFHKRARGHLLELKILQQPKIEDLDPIKSINALLLPLTTVDRPKVHCWDLTFW